MCQEEGPKSIIEILHDVRVGYEGNARKHPKHEGLLFKAIAGEQPLAINHASHANNKRTQRYEVVPNVSRGTISSRRKWEP
jgi:hypothetical protein